MEVFEWICNKCGKHFDYPIVNNHDDWIEEICPSCGSEDIDMHHRCKYFGTEGCDVNDCECECAGFEEV